MTEKFSIPKIKKSPEEEPTEDNFDREAEKKNRKEIKKILVRVISESFKKMDLKKIGGSTWAREVGDYVWVAYLQRMSYAHNYDLEFGIAKVDKIPEGEKAHIAYCKINRHTIGYVVNEIETDENNKKLSREEINDIGNMLDFEEPDAREKNPDEDYKTHQNLIL